MPDLKAKCEHFLQKRLKKLGPYDPEHLNMLALASTHNLSGLTRVLIPKVANLSVDDIRKYEGVIESPLLVRVRDVMLRRYVPGMGSPPQQSGHFIRSTQDLVQCQHFGNSHTSHGGTCVFCTHVYCTGCANAYVCRSRRGRKVCHYCGAENCTCFPEPAEKPE